MSHGGGGGGGGGSGAGAGAGAGGEEDISQLNFGAFAEATWLPNSHVSLLLAEIAAAKYAGGARAAAGEAAPQPPEVFAKAREYATRFVGAVDVTDVAAIDELFASLRGLEWPRDAADAAAAGAGAAAGSGASARLHEYQILAFSNLNPGSVAAARALVPKLDGFSDEEITEVLVLLRRASARSQAGIADLLGAQG